MVTIDSLVRTLDMWSTRLKKRPDVLPVSYSEKLAFLRNVMGRGTHSGAIKVSKYLIPPEAPESHYGKYISDQVAKDHKKIPREYNRLAREYSTRQNEIKPTRTIEHTDQDVFNKAYRQHITDKPYIGEVMVKSQKDWRVSDEKHAVATFFYFQPVKISPKKFGFVKHMYTQGITSELGTKREDEIERIRQYLMQTPQEKIRSARKFTPQPLPGFEAYEK